MKAVKLAIVLLSTNLAALCASDTPKELFKKYKDSIFLIDTGGARGTGFLYRDSDLVVTCFHVISEAEKITIVQAGKPVCEVKQIVAINRELDVAVLRLEKASTATPIPPGKDDDRIPGEPLTVIGNPLGDLTNSLTTGILSAVRPDGGGESIQFTAAISHGSSGSPVLSEAGRLTGIATGSIEEGQSLNLARSSSDLDKLLDSKKPDLPFSQFKIDRRKAIEKHTLEFVEGMEKADVEAQIIALANILTILPKQDFYWITGAGTLREAKDDEGEAKWVDAWVDSNPDSALAWWGMAALKSRPINEYAEPQNIDLMLTAPAVLVESAKSAIPCYERAIALFAEHPPEDMKKALRQTFTFNGYTLMGPKGTKLTEGYFELYEGIAYDSFNSLIYCYEVMGDAPGGLKVMDRALQWFPEEAFFHHFRGRCLGMLKRYKEAYAASLDAIKHCRDEREKRSLRFGVRATQRL